MEKNYLRNTVAEMMNHVFVISTPPINIMRQMATTNPHSLFSKPADHA